MLMSSERLEQLKSIIHNSDDSAAGVALRDSAIEQIKAWNSHLYKFIELNPGTEPARACGRTICQLSNFICNETSFRGYSE